MVLLGVCNPLLDVVAEVPRSLIDEYGLPHGGAVLANEHQMSLFPILEKKYACKYLAGGCGQNTIRVYQALCNNPGESKFLGCIGQDKEGAQLKELLESQGIIPIYKTSATKPTGTCMVLVTDKERCVCTNLGASVDIDEAFVEAKWKEVEACDAVYCTGFLLSSSAAVLLKLARHCQSSGKTFACNLSAEFLMHEFKAEYLEMLQRANVCCGNKEEATKFAELNGMDTTGSVGDTAAQILDLMLKGLDEGANKQKMVVVTQGADPVIVASRTPSGTISIGSYPVPEVPMEKIVDLNGAGDAFVGGLLFGLLHNIGIDAAIELGNWLPEVLCIAIWEGTFQRQERK
ncbi:adenosine kinase b [Cyclospora cayetanensis]|uniref:Adenosine kinase n=1 Tax=Cyclospora cayetanensis TaxID=88456 RepID=A0A1D3CWH0_9EIME|nr:adenosine kinase b [Cyclospora cayetanensis]